MGLAETTGFESEEETRLACEPVAPSIGPAAPPLTGARACVVRIVQLFERGHHIRRGRSQSRHGGGDLALLSDRALRDLGLDRGTLSLKPEPGPWDLLRRHTF